MSDNISASASKSASNRNHASRSLAIANIALGFFFVTAQASQAQSATSRADAIEFRVSSGAFVPAGAQRNALKDAHMTAAQISWVLHPAFAVTGTFGWARSRDVLSTASPKLDVFTSDIGGELRTAEWFAGRRVSFSPFVAVGGGVRSYNYRKLDVDASNNVAGYAGVGGEVGSGRFGLRIEARDYVAGFKPLVGSGKSATRNDVVIMAAFSLNRRQSGK